ncbi:MAG TPA: DUF4339 domain-containing protein [Verrucomicrobiota bacterium]|nr:hypothetical protein [Verrucomicrobiales bacterium]HRI14127.1 DUF4339 domain-containing protein [Verrucomicrobiota bacterium]
MNWFYAEDGQRRGPISEQEFDQLIASGRIRPETLVWHSPMAEWKPLSALRSAHASQPLAPPQLAVPMRGEGGGPSPDLWRDGKVLVMARGAQLPPRCVRCNAAGTWRRKRKLQWIPPWVYLLLFCGLLPLLIVALITRQTGEAEISLCERHRQRRARVIGIGWVAVLLGLAGWIGGCAYTINQVGDSRGVVAVAFGILISLIGWVVVSSAASVLAPRKIDADRLHLRGCCPEFLGDLPTWTAIK